MDGWRKKGGGGEKNNFMAIRWQEKKDNFSVKRGK